MVLATLLIVIGLVLLLQNLGILPDGLWANLWRFWPVLLIAIGANLILGPRLRLVASLVTIALFLGAVGGAAALSLSDLSELTSSLVQPLGDLRSAEVTIAFGAGSLELDSLPGASPNLIEGTFIGRGVSTTMLTSSGGAADLRVAMEKGPWAWGSSSAEWVLSLSPRLPLTLRLDGGAANASLDLRELQVTDLALNLGAADVDVYLPAVAGVALVEINGGAGDFEILVPQGVAARITKSCVACSFDVDEQRFPKVGDRYESPGFATAKNGVTIEVKAAAARISVR